MFSVQQQAIIKATHRIVICCEDKSVKSNLVKQIAQLHGQFLNCTPSADPFPSACTHLIVVDFNGNFKEYEEYILTALATGLYVLKPSYISESFKLGHWDDNKREIWKYSFNENDDDLKRQFARQIAKNSKKIFRRFFELFHEKGGLFADWKVGIVCDNPNVKKKWTNILRGGKARVSKGVTMTNCHIPAVFQGLTHVFYDSGYEPPKKIIFNLLNNNVAVLSFEFVRHCVLGAQSDNVEDHLRHSKNVWQTLCDFNVTLSPNNSLNSSRLAEATDNDQRPITLTDDDIKTENSLSVVISKDAQRKRSQTNVVVESPSKNLPIKRQKKENLTLELCKVENNVGKRQQSKSLPLETNLHSNICILEKPGYENFICDKPHTSSCNNKQSRFLSSAVEMCHKNSKTVEPDKERCQLQRVDDLECDEVFVAIEPLSIETVICNDDRIDSDTESCDKISSTECISQFPTTSVDKPDDPCSSSVSANSEESIVKYTDSDFVKKLIASIDSIAAPKSDGYFPSFGQHLMNFCTTNPSILSRIYSSQISCLLEECPILYSDTLNFCNVFTTPTVVPSSDLISLVTHKLLCKNVTNHYIRSRTFRYLHKLLTLKFPFTVENRKYWLQFMCYWKGRKIGLQEKMSKLVLRFLSKPVVDVEDSGYRLYFATMCKIIEQDLLCFLKNLPDDVISKKKSIDSMLQEDIPLVFTIVFPDNIRHTVKYPAMSLLTDLAKLISHEENSGTFIMDNSSNGTFVNGEKLGRNVKRPLKSNDEISLPVKKEKAFVYIESGSNDNEKFPAELLDKYIMCRTLGRGAMGEVRLAFKKDNCEQVAVKIIQKSRFLANGKNTAQTSKQIQREIRILKAVNHPCVIKVEDVIDTDDCTYLVMELVEGGELFDRIVSKTKLPECVAKLMFYQIFLALKYLHGDGITHRDLKPENILLASVDSDECLVKITDFGLSKFVDDESMMKTFCGTPNYLAPEVLLSAGVGTYTKAVDIWSVGVILFVSLSGYPPFSSDYKDMPIADQIKTGRTTYFKKSWEDVSDAARDLVKKLLVVDPAQRLTIEGALNHPWLQDDVMKRKANEIMYPNSDGMIPPLTTVKMSPQKRGRMESDSTTSVPDMEIGESDRKRLAI